MLQSEISLKKVSTGEEVVILRKGKKVQKVQVGIGWTAQSNSADDQFDLDVAAFALAENRKVARSLDFVFYNNPSHDSNCIIYSGDDTEGTSKAGEIAESIVFDLVNMPKRIQVIAFSVSIYEWKTRKQNFGMIGTPFCEVRDEESGEVLVRYDLQEDFSLSTGIIVAEIARRRDEWWFKAIGSSVENGLAGISKEFGLKVEDEN